MHREPIVICGSSALEYWRNLRVLSARETLSALRAMREFPLDDAPALGTVAPARRLARDLPDILGIYDLSSPLHVLVSEPGLRRRVHGVVFHSHASPLSMCLLHDLGRGMYVCAPELALAQLRGSMTPIAFMELLFEVCGTYARIPGDTSGMPPECPPLTSVDRLREFVGRNVGLHGIGRIRDHLRHVVDGARSPMEAQLAMLLCLPRKMGGFGMPLPTMNLHVDATEEARALAGQGYFLLDLYFPEANLDVEYHGHNAHKGEERRVSDDARANALLGMGIRSLHIWKDQIYEEQRIAAIAAIVARESGRRMRPDSPNTLIRRGELIDELRASTREAAILAAEASEHEEEPIRTPFFDD